MLTGVKGLTGSASCERTATHDAATAATAADQAADQAAEATMATRTRLLTLLLVAAAACYLYAWLVPLLRELGTAVQSTP